MMNISNVLFSMLLYLALVYFNMSQDKLKDTNGAIRNVN